MCIRHSLPNLAAAEAAFNAALHQEATAARTGCPRAKSQAFTRRKAAGHEWVKSAKAAEKLADNAVQVATTPMDLWHAKKALAAAAEEVLRAQNDILTPAERQEMEDKMNADAESYAHI